MTTDSGKVFFEQFIDDYYAECEEHLGSARSLILQLEKAPPAETKDTVLDDLLRNFHSMKGLSAMVGMEEVTQLAHHIEDYLREIKQPLAAISGQGISQILEGINTIELVLSARRKSEPLPDVGAIILMLTTAAAEARPQPSAKKARTPAATRAPGVDRQLKCEFRPSAHLAAKGITVSTVREHLSTLGQVTSSSPRVLDDGGVAFDFTLATNEPESRFDELRSNGLICTGVSEPATASRDLVVPAAAGAATSSSNIIRVDMSRLDELMRIVGELVISRFHLDETIVSAERGLTTAGLRALQDINSLMERQVRDLRQTVIRTRMVPIGQIFEKMRFAVRGLERELHKKVRVEITGQETELDKIIVERMMDPILHLVRNSLSHGIEKPDERTAAGKLAEGTLRLSASTAGDTVLVEVADDGRGIDLENVAQRARGLGLLGREEALDSKRLLDVICSPGFTTRDAADLASGRGVGMAAVMAAVSDLGGLITLHTTAGKGTRFAIQLPLTLSIADSLFVTVERQQFAIPQASVREVFAINSTDITVFQNNEVVPFRGNVLPILRLAKVFGMKAKPRKHMHVLVIGFDAGAVGLVVDRITGQREIVVRAITDPMLRVPGVTGATELGDGRPVLILDAHAIMRSQRERAAAENRS